MAKNNLLTGKEAREALVRGVDQVVDAVKLTLGAAGSNAVLQHTLFPGHLVTNDGVSIAKQITLDDPFENMGANLAKEIAEKADSDAHDGTTTASVLMQAILHEGMKHDIAPMALKRELDACLPQIMESIDSQTKQITVDDVGAVAAISAEDEELGSLIQEIYQKIGKDGIIELDNSGTYDTHYTIGTGVTLRNAGYLSPSMANDGRQAVYKKPLILVTKQKISSINDLNPLVEKILSAGKGTELVIFCDEIEPTVLGPLMFTSAKGIFTFLVIKAPRLWKDWLFEDFAAITGATVVSSETGVSFKNVNIGHLGTCDKIISDKDKTVVVGIKDIQGHIAAIKEQKTPEAELRVSWLNTQSAILYLGASSESELSYKRLKAVDAVAAASLALKGGIVAGGGVALANSAESLTDNTIGGKILRVSLRSPIDQIMRNAGANPEVKGPRDMFGGFNAKTGEWTDMWEAKIIDPALVVKSSVRAAISVAGTVLTTNIVVALPPSKEDKKPSMPVL